MHGVEVRDRCCAGRSSRLARGRALGQTKWMLHLVWDMDGTLVDSTAVVPEAFTGAVVELGGPPVERDEVVAAYSLGVPEVMLAHLLGRPLKEGESEAYYRRLEGVHLEAYPEILDTLRAWRESGQRVAVFTGAAVRGARTLLGAAGIEVDVLVGGDLVERPKPAPDGLYRTAELLGVAVEEVAYIGDAPTDLQAARSAGAVAVAAGWGHLFDAGAAADHVLAHPNQALELAASGGR